MNPRDAEQVFAALLPQDAAVVALALTAPGRPHEFETGRACAQRALERLGVQGTVGRNDETREPLWPHGVAGSITHTRALAVAATMRGAPALGIDLEPQLSPEALSDVRVSAISDAEWSVLGEDAALATALFSAKESLFKFLWPQTHVFVDFPEAVLVGRAEGVLTLEALGAQHRVRYALAHGHAFTACSPPQ
jgi:enterobactin synthetase component D